MSSTSFVVVPFLILLTIAGCVGRPPPSKLDDVDKQPLQTSRPYNIAHRGSNGKFPEETAAAYMFPIITFKEYISIALDAKRVVGINPEIKNPVFINKHVKWSDGKNFEDKFVETLMKYGYKGSYISKEWLKQPAFVQSFVPLTNIANLTDLPKIFLIDDVTVLTEDTNQTYYDITSDSYLDFMKNYVVRIGPWKDTIVTTKNNYLNEVTDLVARAHARGRA